MAKLKLVRGGPARYTLVYGMRLFPARDVALLRPGKISFPDGEQSAVTLHVLEGTRAEVERQLLASVDAFFDIHGKDGA
jgi:hypothetical protein